MVWIFPAGALIFLIVAALVLLFSSAARTGLREDEMILWTEQAVSIWNIPNNPIGRLILLGFTAVIFAGEYQWHTWKNVVPRQSRTALVLVKFFALGAFVVLAFVLMSIIWTLGWGVLTRIGETSYGPQITRHVLSDFVQDYALAASLAFTSTIIAAGYAALAGMLTRSILGGVIVSFGITFVENLSILGLMIIGWFLDIPKIVHLYRFTPGYNAVNVANWINEHAPNTMRPSDEGVFASIVFSDSLEFSLGVLAAWVIGLIALTVFLFQRQDITS